MWQVFFTEAFKSYITLLIEKKTFKALTYQVFYDILSMVSEVLYGMQYVNLLVNLHFLPDTIHSCVQSTSD